MQAAVYKSGRSNLQKWAVPQGKSNIRRGINMPLPQRAIAVSVTGHAFIANGEGLSISMNPTRDAVMEIKDDPRKRAFIQQKEAFLMKAENEPLFLAPHQGKFVVSHNGEILDSDIDLPTLTGRFFGQHGKIQVYITQVNPVEEEASLSQF